MTKKQKGVARPSSPRRRSGPKDAWMVAVLEHIRGSTGLTYQDLDEALGFPENTLASRASGHRGGAPWRKVPKAKAGQAPDKRPVRDEILRRYLRSDLPGRADLAKQLLQLGKQWSTDTERQYKKALSALRAKHSEEREELEEEMKSTRRALKDFLETAEAGLR